LRADDEPGEEIFVMKTARECEESLRKLNLVVHMFGKRVENVVDDPIIRPSMNAVAKTYELAHLPEYEDLITARSHITGKKINRFTHIHQDIEDLVKKSKMGDFWGVPPAAVFSGASGWIL
jgi:4-hydroxybutyryl-CoA dehydratase/vinylacetyl-CoA-Delta-isomerase